MPALAIMLAVGLSFATETLNSSVTGYYDDPAIPGVQSTTTDCMQQPSGVQCETPEGFPLYATPDLDNIPNNELRKDE
ncbi:hypothetical protein ICJ83_05115 [Aestuariibaculum sp. TT11]|uniref:Secreted protein n=1 Tax=Aestuariibaculum sediminum TaxID=2770637 RepID=A0A8J6U763_9FLAO|nr:hypothetical protein [Aestuariibaculum sediminum]